jgi:hypothetical protein
MAKKIVTFEIDESDDFDFGQFEAKFWKDRHEIYGTLRMFMALCDFETTNRELQIDSSDFYGFLSLLNYRLLSIFDDFETLLECKKIDAALT